MSQKARRAAVAAGIVISVLLILGALMLKPANNRFMETFQELQDAFKNSQRTTQPQFTDWVAIGIDDYSINAADSNFPIPYLTTEYTNQLEVGLKVRLKQTGDSDYRYFYVIEKDGLSSSIFVGDDYTLDTGLAITELSISNASAPTGFPASFSYAVTVYNGSTPITTDAAAIRFFMIGRNFRVRFAIIDTSFPAGLTTFDVGYDFFRNTQTAFGFDTGVTDNNDPVRLEAQLTSSTNLIVTTITALDGGTFPTNFQALGLSNIFALE